MYQQINLLYFLLSSNEIEDILSLDDVVLNDGKLITKWRYMSV